MSGGAGGDPLAVLTVDGGALQALEAATRLLCHRVFRPNRETFNCVSKKNGCFVLTRGREGIAARCVSTFMKHAGVNLSLCLCGLTWVAVFLLETARVFGQARLVFSMAASDTDGRLRICAVRKHVGS